MIPFVLHKILCVPLEYVTRGYVVMTLFSVGNKWCRLHSNHNYEAQTHLKVLVLEAES